IEVVLVDQLERNRNAGKLAHPLIAQIRGFIKSELEPDRVERNNHREQRRVARRASCHEIARTNSPIADPSAYRRAQLGIFEIELRLPNRRLAGGERGLRIAE